MSKRLVLLGGGDIDMPGAMGMHRHVRSLCDVQTPRVLFILEHQEDIYIEKLTMIYEHMLRCKISFLVCDNEELTDEQKDAAFAAADVIYLCDGADVNTINTLLYTGLLQRIEDACFDGRLVVGCGAGAMLLCRGGVANELTDLGCESGMSLITRGIGLCEWRLCPHFSNEYSKNDFAWLVLGGGNIGLGIDDLAVLTLKDSSYMTSSFSQGAGVYCVIARDKYTDCIKIVDEDYQPISKIYAMGEDIVDLSKYFGRENDE